jgi:hypothetical protein
VTGYEQAAVKDAAENILNREITVATVAEKLTEKWII